MFDDPLSIFAQCFETVDHVGDAMFGGLPSNPRFATEEVENSNQSVKLALREARYLEHHGVCVASKGQIKQELTEVFPRIVEPLHGPLCHRLARIDMIVLVVVNVPLTGFLVLCTASVILCLYFESIEAELTLLLGGSGSGSCRSRALLSLGIDFFLKSCSRSRFLR